MKLEHPSLEFDRAVAAVCHGEASEEEMRALNLLLRENGAARDEYLWRVELHARLASDRDLFAEPMVDSGEEFSRMERASGMSWVRAGWVMAMAACLALLGVGWWLLESGSVRGLKGERSRAVAMLGRVADAEWEMGGKVPGPAAPLEPGVLRLKSGLAEIVFYSGARLVMEGPVQLKMISSGAVACDEGLVLVDVPPQAKGFRVTTPRMDVVDLGTQWGVRVGRADVETHVFQGSVEVRSPALKAQPPLVVSEGMSVRADHQGAWQQRPADRQSFATLFNLQNRSSEAEVLRHEHWRASSDRLDEDATLLVHLDFESGAGVDWQLPNKSRGGRVTNEATVVGCQWTEGRWADKRALEFRNVNDRVRLGVPGEYGALTLALWVRLQGLDRRINSLFMSDGFEQGTVHWSIRDDGVLALTAIGQDPGEYQICISPRVVSLDQFGLWTHLAVVVDGEKGRITQFVNGVQVSREALKIRPPFKVGPAELGNWNALGFPKNDPFMIRNFGGAMDEFCLFGRALTPEQVRSLHAVGKPQTEPLIHSRR